MTLSGKVRRGCGRPDYSDARDGKYQAFDLSHAFGSTEGALAARRTAGAGETCGRRFLISCYQPDQPPASIQTTRHDRTVAAT